MIARVLAFHPRVRRNRRDRTNVATGTATRGTRCSAPETPADQRGVPRRREPAAAVHLLRRRRESRVPTAAVDQRSQGNRELHADGERSRQSSGEGDRRRDVLGTLEHSAHSDGDPGRCTRWRPTARRQSPGGRRPRHSRLSPPCAPAGVGPLHYQFKLYALDQMLTLPADASRADVMKAMDGHIVGTSTYYAFLERTP